MGKGDKKQDPSTDPREDFANPHTVLERDDPSAGGGFPKIGDHVFVANDIPGALPHVLLVMKAYENQSVDGWLFPTGGGVIVYKTGIRGGIPSQPGTWHHMAKRGRSG